MLNGSYPIGEKPNSLYNTPELNVGRWKVAVLLQEFEQDGFCFFTQSSKTASQGVLLDPFFFPMVQGQRKDGMGREINWTEVQIMDTGVQPARVLDLFYPIEQDSVTKGSFKPHFFPMVEEQRSDGKGDK